MSGSPRVHWKTCRLWCKIIKTGRLASFLIPHAPFMFDKMQNCAIIILNNKKGGTMTAKLTKQEKRIKKILGYDATRKYFGNWCPRDLNATYMNSEPVDFKIGTLSVDDICDSLWSEMSYNPGHFGKTSPFKFNGKNSIRLFKDHSFESDDRDLNIVFSSIKFNMRSFLYHMERLDSSFETNGYFYNTQVTIAHTIEDSIKPVPNHAYSMLAALRKCAKIIAEQNVQDFSNDLYRAHIIKTVVQRHPGLTRPTKIPNFPALESNMRAEASLKRAIWNKSVEINDIESRINTLQNMEPPVDTSAEKTLLNQKQQALAKLEYTLNQIQKTNNGYSR